MLQIPDHSGCSAALHGSCLMIVLYRNLFYNDNIFCVSWEKTFSFFFIFQCLFYKVFSVEQENTFSQADAIFPKCVVS